MTTTPQRATPQPATIEADPVVPATVLEDVTNG